MNYLAGLEEILVGLKPPKIDVVTPLLGQKRKAPSDLLLLSFYDQQTFRAFGLYKHSWLHLKGEGKREGTHLWLSLLN